MGDITSEWTAMTQDSQETSRLGNSGCRLTRGGQQHAQYTHTNAACDSKQPLVQQLGFAVHQQTFYSRQPQMVRAGTHGIQQRLSEAIWNRRSAGA